MKVKLWSVVFVLTFIMALSAVAFDYNAPETKPGENGWEMYVDPPTFDKDAALGVNPGQSTPAAAVTSFYVSRLRGDDVYKTILLPGDLRTRKLRRALEKTKDWEYLKFQLVGKKMIDHFRYWVKISVQVSINGKVTGGIDAAQVRYINGRWIVYTVPS